MRVTASDSAGNNQVSSSTFQFDLVDIYPPDAEAVYPGDGATVTAQVFLDWSTLMIRVALSLMMLKWRLIRHSPSPYSHRRFAGRGPCLSSLTRGTGISRVTVSDGTNSQVSPTWSMTAKRRPSITRYDRRKWRIQSECSREYRYRK